MASRQRCLSRVQDQAAEKALTTFFRAAKSCCRGREYLECPGSRRGRARGWGRAGERSDGVCRSYPATKGGRQQQQGVFSFAAVVAAKKVQGSTYLLPTASGSVDSGTDGADQCHVVTSGMSCRGCHVGGYPV